MMSASVVRRILALGLVAALCTSCSRDPNVRKQKYFESGQRYFEKGKYREAAIQLSNAIQVDPRYAQAHYQLAETYLKLQDWIRAYQELDRTLQLQPENYQAHIEIANLLIDAGRTNHPEYLQQAQEHTDLLLAKQANNPQVHEAVANLLAAQNNLPGAIQEMQKAISLGPDRWEGYFNLALLQANARQPESAELNFKKAIQLNPKALGVQLALGRFYQANNRLPEAEQQFRQAIAVDPKSSDARAALARLYLSESKKAETEEFLKQVKYDLPNNSDAYRMLGDFYFATGDLDKATAEYGSLYQAHPKDLQVKKNYIQLLILKNRLDEASKLNDEVLQADKGDNDALVDRGQIQIREGQAQAATQTLQIAIKNTPDNGVAHYHLGLAFDELGDLARAETEWRDAVALKPDLAEAYRALAAVALRKNPPDNDGLEQAAAHIIALQPGSPDGYALRAVANMNRREFSRAEVDAREAVKIAPQSAVGYIQLGNLSLAQKQFAEAEKSYRQGLDHDPGSVDALTGLMNTYLLQKQVDQAIAAANAQIAKVPNSSAFYDLLGTALFNNKKDFADAEVALKKAAELNKNNADALLKLGQVQVANGATDQGIATYEKSIQDNPREATFYIVLGELYESKHDWEKAKQEYQKALDLKPDDPTASNNLAYVMLETGGNLDVAVSLAQTARRGLPDSPNAADTLGWALYQKGAYRSAIDLFQEALHLIAKNKSPDDPTMHYHLGLAYQKSDQNGLARQQLERVLQINPNYSSAQDVKKILSQLRS